MNDRVVLDQAIQLARQANLAFRQQRYAEAVAGYEKCVALQPQTPAFHFNLGTAREQLGDFAGAVEAYLGAYRLNPQDGRLALFAGVALEAAGRRNEAVTMFTLGDDVDRGIRRAMDDPRLDPEFRRRSAIADRVMREHFTRLHADAVEEAEHKSGQDLSRVRRGIWTQTHDGPVQFRTSKQKPGIFYMPDLEARPITSRERLSWASDIEAKTSEVRDEYLAAIQGGAEMSPYVDAHTVSPVWRELRGRLDWSSLHLFKASLETPFAKLFPRTMKALEAADVVRIDGRPMELFFSRLRPGAHIPPHCGAANNRLTIHLPLIVPGGCSIRVGSETHVWHEGKLFAFDDSFEHEAWNRSSEDRVVLIFESHHPDLRPEERDAIEFAFEERGRWLRERRVPS